MYSTRYAIINPSGMVAFRTDDLLEAIVKLQQVRDYYPNRYVGFCDHRNPHVKL